MGTARELLPGLALLAAIAVVSWALATQSSLLSPLVLAVGLGVLVGNIVDLPASLEPGVAQHDLLLETAIVLLGASVPLMAVIETGPRLLALVVGTVVAGVLLVEGLARLVLARPGREGSLLAAGASICGVSAVVAVARSIDADRETLAYVAGGILLFDAITLVAFPALAGVLGLPDRAYGVWAGLAMFSTGPVAAAGFAVSAEAGRWATITKLVRNAFIGVLAVGYAMAYARAGDARPSLGSVWAQFPKFLVGFLAMALIANTGLLTEGTLGSIAAVTDGLFLVAFAGVGLSIRLEAMREAGLVPIAVLASYLVVVGGLALLAVMAVF